LKRWIGGWGDREMREMRRLGDREMGRSGDQ